MTLTVLSGGWSAQGRLSMNILLQVSSYNKHRDLYGFFADMKYLVIDIFITKDSFLSAALISWIQ